MSATTPPSLLSARAALPADGAERFADRALAGRRLAALLGRYRGSHAVVLALPPGGVVVGAELARSLSLPLDVFVAREFHARASPAAPAGAVAEGGGMCLNAAALRRPGVTTCAIWQEARAEQAAVAALVARYRGARPPDLPLRAPVILVDDGLASGLAQLAAIRVLRRSHPLAVAVATPWGVDAGLAAVERWADELAWLEHAPAAGDLDARADHWLFPIDDDTAAAVLAAARA